MEAAVASKKQRAIDYPRQRDDNKIDLVVFCDGTAQSKLEENRGELKEVSSKVLKVKCDGEGISFFFSEHKSSVERILQHQSFGDKR